MKAVISNRIQLQGNADFLEKLERELTYSLPPRMPQDPPIIYKTIRPLREGLVSIPAGRLDLIPEDYEIIDKRVQAPTDMPEFRYELRANQRVVHDEVDDCAIINAWVSWGKTITALAIAKKLGQKTLVVTHTTNLRNQWEKEVKKSFDLQPGRIGSGASTLRPR